MTIYGAIPRGAYRQMPKSMPRSLGFERYALGFKPALLQRVDCGNPLSLNIATAITIELLVRSPIEWDTQSAWAGLVNKYSANLGYQIAHRAATKTVLFQVRRGEVTPFIASSTLAKDTLYHLVATFDGTNMRLFKNGEIDAAPVLNPGAIGITASPLYIGRQAGDYFNGLIPLVRIYKDYALSQEEVRWNRLNYHNPVRPDKLVLWLPMEEGSGLVAADHSGLGNNGALLPVATPPTWEQVRQYELRAQTE